MSKFFISNNLGIAHKIKERILNSEYQLCANIEQDDLYIYSTKKLLIDNSNYYQNGRDFVVATGTLLFNKQQNLKLLYDTYSSINQIRENCVGQYAISICKNDDVMIFTDPVAAYDIYYYHNKNNNIFVISNSLYDLACVVKEKLTINELNIIEQVTEYAILGGETYFNEILRLDGEHTIHIRKGNFEIIKNGSLFKPYQDDLSFEESYKELSKQIYNTASIIYNTMGDPDISMTGGLDARTSLAAYLAVGSKPHLNYGVGNSALTNTFHDDYLIDVKLGEKFNLSLNKQDWSTPNPMDKYWDEFLLKYGFFYKIYAASDCVFDSFSNYSQNITTFGYGGELYRNLPWTEKSKKQYFSINDFYEEYYKSKGDSFCTEDIIEYKSHILNKLIAICEKYNLNPERIKMEDNFLLMLEYRKVADTVVMNFLNQFKYSNLILLDYNCLIVPRPSVENLRNSKFQLYVINELYPDVLDIPVFSHCRHVFFNKEKMCLEPRLRNQIVNTIPPILLPLALKVKKVIFGGKKKDTGMNSEIKEILINYNNKINLPMGLKFNFDHELRIPTYYFMIKKIIESIINK